MADAVEDSEEIVYRLEAQQALTELAALENLGFKRDGARGIGEGEDFADGDLFARTNEGAPEVFSEWLRFVLSHPFRRRRDAGPLRQAQGRLSTQLRFAQDDR